MGAPAGRIGDDRDRTDTADDQFDDGNTSRIAGGANEDEPKQVADEEKEGTEVDLEEGPYITTLNRSP